MLSFHRGSTHHTVEITSDKVAATEPETKVLDKEDHNGGKGGRMMTRNPFKEAALGVQANNRFLEGSRSGSTSPLEDLGLNQRDLQGLKSENRRKKNRSMANINHQLRRQNSTKRNKTINQISMFLNEGSIASAEQIRLSAIEDKMDEMLYMYERSLALLAGASGSDAQQQQQQNHDARPEAISVSQTVISKTTVHDVALNKKRSSRMSRLASLKKVAKSAHLKRNSTQLPSDWAKHLDGDSGKRFYENKKTGSVQWHPPEGSVGGRSSAAVDGGKDWVPPVPKEGLPEGWDMEQWKYYGKEYLQAKADGSANL
jgi:hypothetical protein